MRVEISGIDGPVWRGQLRPTVGGGDLVLSGRGLDQLTELAERADESATCRALVIEGSDGVFCRGMDLADRDARPEADLITETAQYARCLRALRSCCRPTIAAVDGVALAGGVGLAVACDLIIATERSSFGLPEVMLGLVPAMVVPLLLERMPPQKVRRLAMSPLAIDARAAQSSGLVDQLVTDGSSLEGALRGQLKTLLRVDPRAVGRLKRHVESASRQSVEQGLDEGARLTARLLADPQTRAAITAFVKGDPLAWFARYRPASKTKTREEEREPE